LESLKYADFDQESEYKHLRKEAAAWNLLVGWLLAWLVGCLKN
jgi:hypothetical protein